MSEAIKNRYEFVILFDVENGNPNGDPDAGNMPRVDPETGLGLVTDVCLKRKIRNYVETVKEDATGYRIYIKDGVPLNRSDAEAYAALDVTEKTVKAKKKENPDLDRNIRDWMCANFYDIRTFGAVMTTFVKAALNCGQVRGPVQMGFARSVEPVVPQEVTITRVAITTEADAENKGTEMGRKYIVPYGLYRCEGYISANLARKTTGFSEKDLELLWEAILNLFEHDHSAARGKMAVRELIIFKHDSELGWRTAQLAVMLEDDQLPHCHFAPGGGVVVLEQVQDGFPQQFQVFFGEAGGLPCQVGGDIAFAAVEAVGDNVLAAHFGALVLCVRFGGDGHTGDGHFLGHHRFHAPGKAHLDGATNLAAVQCRLDEGGHDGAKGTDVIEIGAHPVPNVPIQVWIFLLLCLHRLFRHIQRRIGFCITAVQGHAVLNVDAIAGGVLLHRLHIVPNLPLQAHVSDQPQTRFRVYTGHIAGVRVAVGVAVFHVKENHKFISVLDRFAHLICPPSW